MLSLRPFFPFFSYGLFTVTTSSTQGVSSGPEGPFALSSHPTLINPARAIELDIRRLILPSQLAIDQTSYNSNKVFKIPPTSWGRSGAQQLKSYDFSLM
ncbi:hypothetical protein D9613_005705 [Agrocybe pediades]|uniref:Uncharacterized protein n=1 Tax=Agrocybe pediades TaxID=84607 RepID=A0A8H4VPS2_9AGAR|nr:hypothetical protein D9613_005705 [Agrocybe pediades]